MDQHTRVCMRFRRRRASCGRTSSSLPSTGTASWWRFRSKYDPMAMVDSNETNAQFILTDVLRAMLFGAEQREAQGRLPCTVLNSTLQLVLLMGADLLRNGLSGIGRSNRRLRDVPTSMARRSRPGS